MRRALVIGALVLAGVGVGAGTVVASGALDGDDPVDVITVRTDEPVQAGRLVIEDGIARADAQRLADAAVAEVSGSALSVERDDGLFEVEVRADDGRHHEVLLDDGFDVVATDQDD